MQRQPVHVYWGGGGGYGTVDRGSCAEYALLFIDLIGSTIHICDIYAKMLTKKKYSTLVGGGR